MLSTYVYVKKEITFVQYVIAVAAFCYCSFWNVKLWSIERQSLSDKTALFFHLH